MTKTNLRIIFNEDEWRAYAAIFPVSRISHKPQEPPSYPVLVASTLAEERHVFDGPTYSSLSHSFVELAELKRMLGIQI